jgi:outer membrane protein assembly factor BamB
VLRQNLRSAQKVLLESLFLSVSLWLAWHGSGAALKSDRPDPEVATRPDGPQLVKPRLVGGYDWLQFGLDAQHTGHNALEWHVTPGNVSSLRKLFRVPMLDVADGAPVYLGNVSTASGVRDLIFVTTAAGFVIAHDACAGSRVWFRGPTEGTRWTTSLPAIDPDRRYVYSYQLDGFVHKFLVGDGTEVLAGGWPQLVTRKPEVEKCSSDLAFVAARDGRRFLYAAIAGYPGPGPGDQGDYQGHVTAIDLDSGNQTIFNTLCSDRAIHFDNSGAAPGDCTHVRAAVWGRAGITYDSVTDRVFFTTGNGDFDADQGGRNWGDSVLALAPDLSAPGGVPADSYTPTEYQQLDDNDADLGSSTPLILPDPIRGGLSRLMVQTGKDGLLRLLNVSDLSGRGGPGHVGGERAIVPVPQGGGVLTAPAAWLDPVDQSVWFFVANEQGIAGLHLGGGSASLPTVGWKQDRGGTSPIVANGVLYYAGTGFIAALDPRTGQELWSDHAIGEIHWQSPILVNGVLYVADDGPTLAAYALAGTAEARPDGPCH